MNKKLLLQLFTFLSLALSLSSCLTYKQIVNFQDGDNLGKVDTVQLIQNFEPLRIKPDDIVQVIITSYNREESERFNLISTQQVGMGQQQAGASVADPYGYRVDSKGFIEMPVLGQVPAAGKTMEELRTEVDRRIAAKGYLKDWSIQMRFLTFRITVLGEVNNPGTYTIPSQKITVLEALGLGGDATVFSNRDNILVIREESGLRKYGRVDIKSKQVFNSDYYYLQPGDIVYVEPHKSKILSAPDPASRYLGIFLGIASLIAIIVAIK